jgi:hypothetical protein
MASGNKAGAFPFLNNDLEPDAGQNAHIFHHLAMPSQA